MKKEVLISIVLLALGLVGVSIPVGWHFFGPKKDTTPPPPAGTLQIAAVKPTPEEPPPPPIAPPDKKSEPKPVIEKKVEPPVEKKPEPTPPIDKKPEPPPEKQPDPKPMPPIEKQPDPKPIPKIDPKPPIEKQPDLRPPEKIPEIVKLPAAPNPAQFRSVQSRHIDNPDGEYQLPNLNDRTYVKLTGKVKTLKIGHVDGESYLDASGLEAKEIILFNHINTRSTAKLNAPGGKVELRGAVDTESKLEIQAAGGTVEFQRYVNTRSQVIVNAAGGSITFIKNPMKGHDAFIDNGAKLTLLAKMVEFGSWINGQTRIDVTITRDGTLHVANMRGQSQLVYRRADPTSPVPRLSTGPIEPTARLRLEGQPAVNIPMVEPKAALLKLPHGEFDPKVFRKVEEKKLDNPNGDFTVPNVDNKKVMKLTGKVKTLRIGFVDNGSVLDASGLEAKEIIFQDRLSGKSFVFLNAPGGKVEFRNMVTAMANLDINAPGGKVTFQRHDGGISGEARLKIVGQDVEFNTKIVGQSTKVEVTLTPKGLLRYYNLNGAAQLQYRLANPGDPEPMVRGGTVQGRAKVQRVD